MKITEITILRAVAFYTFMYCLAFLQCDHSASLPSAPSMFVTTNPLKIRYNIYAGAAPVLTGSFINTAGSGQREIHAHHTKLHSGAVRRGSARWRADRPAAADLGHVGHYLHLYTIMKYNSVLASL